MSRQPERPRLGAGKTDEAFLSRWSRLKVDESTTKTAVAPGPEAAEPEAVIEGGQLTEEQIVASLPDIESLEEVSDFTPFLRDGVPELLKRQALRRLWRINPAFGEIDGLAEYAEDYTDTASVLAEVKTAYKVGRGYLDEDVEDETTAENLPETGTEDESELAVGTVPESDPVPELESAPQAPETASPQADLTLANSEGGKEAEPMPRAVLVPRATKGRAAARRWALPES